MLKYCLIILLTLLNGTMFSQTVITEYLDDTELIRSGYVLLSSDENRSNSFSKESISEHEVEGYVYFILAYLINPVMSVEINDRLKWGWTKEISLGFGNLGQYRTSIEYTYLDREYDKNILRAGLKYDILLKTKLNLADDPVQTSVFTIGGGYFTDFNKYGYFPELSYGYSFRDSKFLLYPSIKLRYTFINESPDIIDFSFGLVVGFANPFTHYDKPNTKKTE